ncbi:MAG: S8 family serine peptidase [Terrimicrobiaceae bacterium]
MPNEWLVKFQSSEELEPFLAQVRNLGGRVLGVIPRLGVARVGFDTDKSGRAIRDLLPPSANADYNFLVAAPAPPTPGAEPGGPSVGFGTEALTWLGVPADNADWGQGIKIAILDTGITEVPGLSLQGIRQLDLVDSGVGSPDSLVHGTAVASLLGGTANEARGMVPAAELLSIRVLDDSGTGDSFTTAEAVLYAVDEGARVISMSLGTAGDSQVLRDAIQYAISQNVAVVAAVGNDGVGSVYYPANYPGVIAVSAVDAKGQRGIFSNYGSGVTVAAPGVGVVTPWVNDRAFSFSGTSAAVPFVSGALTMLLSENPNLTAARAAQILVSLADDAGTPGKDAYYGAGILNVGRIINRNQPNLHDIAIADYYFNPQDLNTSQPTIPVQVTIQNRGTSTLSSVSLDVVNNGQSQRSYFNAVPSGSVRTQTISIPASVLRSQSGSTLQSQVRTIGVQDVNPANNQRSATLRLK